MSYQTEEEQAFVTRRHTCRECQDENYCKLRECRKCELSIPECSLFEKPGLGVVCVFCAHAYELSIQPCGHDENACPICKIRPLPAVAA